MTESSNPTTDALDSVSTTETPVEQHDEAPADDVQAEVVEAADGAGAESSDAEELLLQLEEEPAPGEVVIDDVSMRRALEAILMVTDEPLPALVLARAVGRPVADVTEALKELAGEYTEQGRGFDLREVGGGWRYYTRPAEAQYVEKFVLDGQQARLTQAALETLAVVAYKQPVSRQRVSAIRGVNVDGVMRTLISRGLVEDAGADTESQATLYRTSTYFLERMGMQTLDDLPELAPYLPEMDDMEEELAAQNTPTAEAVGTPDSDEAVTSDVGAAGIDGDLSTGDNPQLDLEHEEPELEPAEELEAGGDTELDQEEADPAEIPETGSETEETDDSDDDSEDDGEIVVPADDTDDEHDDDDEDDLVEDSGDEDDGDEDDHLESAEELTGETEDVRMDAAEELTDEDTALDGVPVDDGQTVGDDSDAGSAQYRVRSDD
ncbi:SMC-Scp complex subunit ScpB [Kribbella sp. DT2]|uniref:SMC-Scp complex subunit ScpB n=1 Tax=Kribbella sp. DT2 TaxID=3393427 RepID=UPI003CF30E45